LGKCESQRLAHWLNDYEIALFNKLLPLNLYYTMSEEVTLIRFGEGIYSRSWQYSWIQLLGGHLAPFASLV
jgi:hypothetical protein